MSAARKIAVIGLGYVGLPVAVSFGHQHRVIAFDISQQRIAELQAGHDRTNEVDPKDLQAAQLVFTADATDLAEADFYIVTVPTPIDGANRPDMGAVLAASQTVGSQLKQGDIVVYESTVYPGATEEDCLPVLEAFSGLKAGHDFFVGYSPERINPGDKEHRFETIKKVVSGQTPEIAQIVADTYASVVTAGVHMASSIKVAEASKVIENTQRDLNIAFVNELALIFEKVGIDTIDVLEAAGTKWNFLPFRPGLVGGHCIGVDPYYLTHKAEQLGHSPEVILAGRHVNDKMGRRIAQNCIKSIMKRGCTKQAVVTILGLTFKENVPDIRNSRVIDIIRELQDYGVEVQICDPYADAEEAKAEYGITLTQPETAAPADALILAVAHDEYIQKSWTEFQALLKQEDAPILDIKSVLPRETKPDTCTLWRL